jgi:hypothetical protein
MSSNIAADTGCRDSGRAGATINWKNEDSIYHYKPAAFRDYIEVISDNNRSITDVMLSTDCNIYADLKHKIDLNFLSEYVGGGALKSLYGLSEGYINHYIFMMYRVIKAYCKKYLKPEKIADLTMILQYGNSTFYIFCDTICAKINT